MAVELKDIFDSTTEETSPDNSADFLLMLDTSADVVDKVKPSSILTAERTASATLTNKTISLGSNTVSGTIAQFNSALTDGDFATGGGTVTGTSSGTNTGDQDLSGYFNKSADDTDDITAGATNKFATAAEKAKLANITVTQPVDLDAMESDTATNNAKVTNATHTGEVTGATALTVDKTAITGKTAVSPVGADYLLISDTSDSGNLKKALISDLPGTGGGLANIVEDTTPQLGGNLDLNGFTVGSATAADLTKLNAVTASETELNYVDGVTSAIQTQIDGKQATLVSATNIKTINSTSLLGSGDISITGSISDGDKGDITVSSSGTVWSVDNLVTSAITYYVCPSGQTTANYNGDGLNTSVTPSDSNDGLTKSTPLATIAAAVAKFANKILLAPVTIQLADTDATKAYFPQNVEISNLCAGGAYSSILEKALTGRADTYPAAYVYIKGNLSSPNNVNVTGAATYNGTTSTVDCAFVARESKVRSQGFKANYFRAANGDTGAITGYNSDLYVEDLNATSDHTGNDGYLVAGFFGTRIYLGGTFNVTNSGFVGAHANSIWQTYSPRGYASGTLSKSGTGFMMFTNEHSHGMFEGGTWTFSGAGAYYAQAAWTHSSINWNGDATTTITYNGANITGLYAAQSSTINEGAGVNMTVTLTSILKRAFARNASVVSYGGTTSGTSDDTADGGSKILRGTYPFTVYRDGSYTKRISILGGNAKPDTSGNCWFEPYSVLASNDVWDFMIARFGLSNAAAPTTRIGLHGMFQVPMDYASGAKFIPVWTSTLTSGDVVWDIDYRTVGGDNTTSLDQTSNEQSLTVTDTAPGAAHRRLLPELSATAANFTAGETVTYTLFRDGVDAADTLAGSAILLDIIFEYTT